MNLLLDSHTLIWALSAPERLKLKARSSIEDSTNMVFYSTASIWEISIKSSKGLLRLSEHFLDSLAEAQFRELPIRTAHAWAIHSLRPIHNDPFDRMLVAQAHVERSTLVTRDRFLEAYGVPILEA